MNRTLRFLPALAGLFLTLSGAVAQPTRITPADLTLDEKIHLLSVDMGITRLGVPVSYYSEGMHGIAYGGPAPWGNIHPVLPTTSFPQAYGLAQTWDPALMERVAAQISLEQRWYFQNPATDRGGLIIWGPNVDLGRDPRWGRTDECYGEDPWLVAEMAKGYVRGAQGPDPDHWSSACVLKHFIANSYENGRHYWSSEISERAMREYYAYTFYKCITEAGCRGFMTAYNPTNGVPMTIHPLIREMALAEWGQDGIVITDQDGARRLVDDYHLYPDLAEACAASVKAGITQFLSDEREDSQTAIREALRRGLLTEADLDGAIQRNLNVEEKLGLLGGEDPYGRIGRDGGPAPSSTAEAAALCREVTAKSVVLMKNDGILPLRPAALKKVALIGPYADEVLQDWYGGEMDHAVTIYQGLKEALGEDVEILLETKDFGGEGLRKAAEADVAIVVAGNIAAPCLDITRGGAEIGWGHSMIVQDGMEEVDRQSLALPHEDILRLVYGVNPNTVLLLVTTFPYTIRWSKDHLRAIVQLTHGSEEMGHGVADVLLGKVNPAGRLTQTWPERIEDLPPIMDFDLTKGRTYWFAKARPLFCFGHGLSYTSFKYGRLQVSDGVDGVFRVSVDVTNTGALDGDEVVQVYAQYPGSKVVRPERQLRGFKRVTIPAGQTLRVEIPVAAQDLAYWSETEHRWVVEKGRVRFLVGASSADIRCRKVRRIR